MAGACLSLGLGLLLSAEKASALTFTNYTTANGLGNNFVNGIYASGGSIYAATAGGVSVSTNNGVNWTNYTTANGLGSNNVRGVYAIGSNIYAANQNGISISNNNGTNWSNSGFGFCPCDKGYGVIASGSSIYAATYDGLKVSTNNGASWTTIPDGGNDVLGVYVDGSNIYAARGGGGGLSVSTNNGSSWTNTTTANGLGDNAVYGVYASGSSLYAATAGGVSIASLSPPSPPSSEVPGPLPLLGAGAAFSWSRRLRRRLSGSKQPAHAGLQA